MKNILIKVVKFTYDYRQPIGVLIGGILIATGSQELGHWVQSFSS